MFTENFKVTGQVTIQKNGEVVRDILSKKKKLYIVFKSLYLDGKYIILDKSKTE